MTSTKAQDEDVAPMDVQSTHSEGNFHDAADVDMAEPAQIGGQHEPGSSRHQDPAPDTPNTVRGGPGLLPTPNMPSRAGSDVQFQARLPHLRLPSRHTSPREQPQYRSGFSTPARSPFNTLTSPKLALASSAVRAKRQMPSEYYRRAKAVNDKRDRNSAPNLVGASTSVPPGGTSLPGSTPLLRSPTPQPQASDQVRQVTETSLHHRHRTEDITAAPLLPPSLHDTLPIPVPAADTVLEDHRSTLPHIIHASDPAPPQHAFAPQDNSPTQCSQGPAASEFSYQVHPDTPFSPARRSDTPAKVFRQVCQASPQLDIFTGANILEADVSLDAIFPAFQDLSDRAIIMSFSSRPPS